MNRFKKIGIFGALLLFCLLGCLPETSAQFFGKEKFGKNRVQYKKFDWQFVSTANFDIYYYEGGYEIARMAAIFAETDFNTISDLVGHTPYNKTKIFVYTSNTDLLQSNIGINYQGFEVGGQTRFVRSEIEVAFTGVKQTFRNELRRGISDVLIFEMMYGGNLKEILQSNFLLSLPEWFMAGAVEYAAEGWSVEMDNFMREMLLSNRLKKLGNLSGREAAIVGQSVWNFIAEEYGRGNIASVLNLTRLVRNEELSIQNTLGTNFNSFIKQWKEYYNRQLVSLDQNYTLPTEQPIYENKKNRTLATVRLSPDGQKVAFTENLEGSYAINVLDLQTQQLKRVFSGGYRVINQPVDYSMPMIGWRSDEELSFFAYRGGQLYFWAANISGKKITLKKRLFKEFNQIEGFDISPDGQQLVFSASAKGQNDLYLHDLKNRTTRQLTDDVYDNIHPAFLPGGRGLVFSSNRSSDTLKLTQETDLVRLSANFNVFMLPSLSDKVARRLTNSLSADVKPRPLQAGHILFSSDQRGIHNLYRYHLVDSLYSQVSRNKLNYSDYDVRGGKLVYLLSQGGVDMLMLEPAPDTEVSTFTNKTYRQQVYDLRTLQELKRKRAEKEELAQEELLIQQAADTLPSNQLAKDEVDTDNYQFDTFSQSRRKSFLERYKSRSKTPSDREIRISKPELYENRFTVDNLVSSIQIDPLRSSLGTGGWGLLFDVAMTDVLENHKINAGLFGLTNLNNSNFYVEYEYLRRRFDIKGKYERQNFELLGETFTHRYSMHLVEAALSYPLNITTRFRIAPFFTETRFTNTSISSLSRPDRVRNYVGFNAEAVFDNSVITGVNMLEGTRAKIRYEQFVRLNDPSRSFGMVMADARNYFKLHRSLVLATRLSGGAFVGRAKKNFLLGGMDNWLFNRTDISGENDPLAITNENQDMTDLFFSRFVTSMRGFNYNKWPGNNYILFNTELRLPLVKYFYKGTITSNFFRNLQVAAFTDVGTAWTGPSPFNRDNSLNTDIIRSGPFRAEVQNFKNPFLVGYGFGARSFLLGHYTKFDVAWGMEDRNVSKPMFYLTLGYDF